MTYLQDTDNQSFPLISNWLTQSKELAPHLKPILERLSLEHCSGIALSQLESPMMKQFRQSKDEAPDALLFFRMGDFYELFGLDAIIASDICGLTLTSRDKSSPNPVPMAGVPVVGYKNALRKCVLAGFKVAVCEQIEDPKLAKGIVKREIVRIATPAVPGDLADDENQMESQHGCYLASIIEFKKCFTFSYVDVSTGEFRITSQLSESLLIQEISTILPRELLVPQALISKIKTIITNNQQQIPTIVSPIELWILRSESACKELFCEFFVEKDFNRFGLSQTQHGLTAVAAILHYLKNTQKNVLQNIKNISTYELSQHLIIDGGTRKHLDFFTTSSGDRKGSLFHFLNKCKTAVGSRLLLHKLKYPFKKQDDVAKSHNKITDLLNHSLIANELTVFLKETADIERILSRAAQKHLDTRGMAWLRNTLILLPKFKETIETIANSVFYTEIQNFFYDIDALKALSQLLKASLVEDPAPIIGKGGTIFQKGFSSELDKAIDLTTNFNDLLANLEKKERENAQIATLKIGYTGAFGYYFEISKGKIAQAPKHFIRKQTLTNCERYITPELKELEEQALHAAETRATLEKELLETIRVQILEHSEPLLKIAQCIAEVDLTVTFAQLAQEFNWCKPILTEENITELQESVHPILAQFAPSNEPFIANDITLGHQNGNNAQSQPLIHLITGPNMAGKSTIMRQVAVAQVLCQIGCFVPASNAKIGMVDRIFTRIGSGDNALKNQSTFMVEMLETAHMLQFATEKSLLILDEIGRGTSTFDGLSLAWSILESLHNQVKARTLFSTHYHELQDVVKNCPNILPMHMQATEIINNSNTDSAQKSIQFTRKYKTGAAGKSYGLHVAELAGIPQNIIQRASEVLQNLETQNLKRACHLETAITPISIESDKGHEPKHTTSTYKHNELQDFLAELDLDLISPKNALDTLYALKEMIQTHEILNKIALESLVPQQRIHYKTLKEHKKRKETTSEHKPTLF